MLGINATLASTEQSSLTSGSKSLDDTLNAINPLENETRKQQQRHTVSSPISAYVRENTAGAVATRPGR